MDEKKFPGVTGPPANRPVPFRPLSYTRTSLNHPRERSWYGTVGSRHLGHVHFIFMDPTLLFLAHQRSRKSRSTTSLYGACLQGPRDLSGEKAEGVFL